MNRKAKKTRRYVGVRLNADLYEDVSKVAKREDRSVSYVVNTLLAIALRLKKTNEPIRWVAQLEPLKPSRTRLGAALNSKA